MILNAGLWLSIGVYFNSGLDAVFLIIRTDRLRKFVRGLVKDNETDRKFSKETRMFVLSAAEKTTSPVKSCNECTNDVRSKLIYS